MSEVKQEWLQKDYYKILGVPAKAGEAEITKAFRELARKYHPDKNAGDAAAERFKEISAAYDVLGNDSKRKSYDEFRRLAASGMPFGASGPNGSHSFQFSAGGGLGDLLADFLGGRSPSGFSGSTPGSGNEYFGGSGRMNIPHKGSDVHSSVTVTFEEALEGVTLQVPAPPGSRRRAKLTVRVPPGVSDAQQIRLRGKGSPGSGGGSPGDMILKVKVRPHRFFGREGNDLTLKVPVSLSEAALGAKIRVPTYYRTSCQRPHTSRHAARQSFACSRARTGTLRRQGRFISYGGSCGAVETQRGSAQRSRRTRLYVYRRKIA